MIAELPLLSLIIWTPILGGLLVMLIGSKRSGLEARVVALLVSIVTFIFSLPLWTHFDSSLATMQFVERLSWVPMLNIEYALGVDGISMPLILLTTFMTVLVVIAGWEVIKFKPAQYMAAFLIMEGLMVGVFSALDAMLFYVMWEAMLIPMFIVIGIWGGDNRVYATLKFFLYTFLGSVLMLVALLWLARQSGSFSILEFHQIKIALVPQILIFIAFLIAFAVKIPMWPVHTWLPDAHVQAPTGGSVILAAIMLKLGAYGFLRFSLPIAPDASETLTTMMIVLSLIAIAYIGFVALVQEDMKKLIAYSSISHMGFVTLGIFLVFQIQSSTGSVAGAAMGMQGALVQMIAHGFVSGAMFLSVGVLYDRMHSRKIGDYGGVVNTMPIFAALWVLFAMANAGLPGTAGFVGEFMVILSAFKGDFWIAFIAATTLILGAAYTLWMIKRVVFGAVANDHVAELKDINLREGFVLGILAVMVLAVGIYPAPLLEVMQATVDGLITHIQISKL
jgi:NADH-quinone oxidoreductase subunit M